MSDPLPTPRLERWQPLRSGLINLFKYDDQVFRFEHGRLLLRGNNGTGKSRVLALQLPFLLDGETHPSRVEPDQDPHKRMEWNLLMGDHDDRLGYSWLEFGRRDAEGEHYLTIGCGMRAVRSRSGVTTWFFITPQRVGDDLHLINEQRVPLTKDRLKQAVGDDRVFETAKAYRRRIDEALFGLGEHRYDALLKLLIQLRHPQLARKLEEHVLSKALSEALPPLADAVIADVAEAMSALEKDQLQLEDYRAAQRSVAAFLTSYRSYARAAARRAAAPVRRAHADYEQARRDYGDAAQHAVAAERELAAIEEQIGVEEQRRHRLTARLAELAQSPEMKSAQQLTEAAEQAEAHGREVERRDADRTREAQQAARLQKRVRSEQVRQQEQRNALERSLRAAGAAAEAATLVEPHREGIDLLRFPEASAADAVDRAAAGMNAAAEQRKRQAEHLKQRQAEVTGEQAAFEQAADRHAVRKGDVEAALARQREAAQALEAEVEALMAAYQQWVRSLEQLAPADADEVRPSLEAWLHEPAEGLCPVTAAVRRAEHVALGRIAEARAGLLERKNPLHERHAELAGEIGRLEAGVHAPPPVPHTRAEGAREGRRGAAFWELVDFAPGLEADAHAGLEAALEAAGLLDAWVAPDGRVLDADGDALLIAGDASRGPTEATLAQALRPSEALPADVGRELVEAVLDCIGLGESSGAEAWVTTNGWWRVGPLQGRWWKVAAQHIGQAAREAERQRRLADLRRELERCVEAIEDLERRIADRDRARREAEAEARQAPGDATIRRCLATVESAHGRVVEARTLLVEAENVLADRRTARDAAVAQRDQDARDLKLVAWIHREDELIENVQRYRQVVAALAPALHHYREVCRHVEEAGEAAQRADEAVARAGEALKTAKRQHEAAQQRYDVLHDSVGQNADEVMKKHEATKQELQQLEGALEASRRKHLEAVDARARADQRRDESRRRRTEHDQTRSGAIEALRRFTATGLVEVAGDVPGERIDPESEWSTTRGVDIARRLDAAFQQADASDATWGRLSGTLLQELETLKTSLGPRGYPPQYELTEASFHIITVPYQNQRRSIVEMASLLEEEIGTRQNLLDAREKMVIENHLIDEVAAHLHDLIQRGESLVASINEELSGRTTSVGKELRFSWEVADSQGDHLSGARRQLLQNPDVQTPEQRAAMAEFLQQQIRATREANDMHTWRECLSAALDYRRWHRFAVQQRHGPAEPWQRLTRRLHGTGSGGEKAIALTIPQFAAASAHYHSAAARAPRLIMLDEAFVGVDPDMRSQCMELLQQFDLDFVMTSESEWGCYPGLSGNAIYQLSTSSAVNAVLCTRWVWNGRQRVRDAGTDRAHPVSGNGNGRAADDGQLDLLEGASP